MRKAATKLAMSGIAGNELTHCRGRHGVGIEVVHGRENRPFFGGGMEFPEAWIRQDLIACSDPQIIRGGWKRLQRHPNAATAPPEPSSRECAGSAGG